MVFVLVHGGWHGGWCWSRLEPLLRRGGHDVYRPTLTGVGDRRHLAGPDVGLATHVEDVVALLRMDDLDDVVLVGHSSGGAVITGVAQREPGRVVRLVYLDAFVPGPGQSVFDLLPPERAEYFRSLVDGSARIVLDPDVAMDGWAVRAPSDRDWIGPRLCPHPLGGLADPLPPGPVPDVPRLFVHCTAKPGADPFAGFAAAVRDTPGWRVEVLDAGHDAMVTAPEPLSRLLLASP